MITTYAGWGLTAQYTASAVALTQLLGHMHSTLKTWTVFSKRSTVVTVPSVLMIVHNKMMLMQARRLVYKLMQSGWQYEQASSVCKTLFDYATYGIYEGFCQVG
jgi:hypothetical protein